MNIDFSKFYCRSHNLTSISYFYFFEKKDDRYEIVFITRITDKLKIKIERDRSIDDIINTLDVSREISKKEALKYVFEDEE